MSEQEISVSAQGVTVREVTPAEDHSDNEVTASGEELEALVAEHVMGHQWAARGGGRWLVPAVVYERFVSEQWQWSLQTSATFLVPAYTDPNEHGSEDVIEAMRAHGYWCEMRSPWTQDDSGWWAGFTPHGATGWNGRPDHWHSGATLPEAVCRAAVAAMLERTREAEA